MVFLCDTASAFDAPLEIVWEFVGSRERHSTAHGHRHVSRERLPGNAGEYSWEQEFMGSPTRFTMRWTSFHPLGLAYEVLEGPFAGSKFFLIYEPDGPRTRVSIFGEFVSPALRPSDVKSAVERFFAREYEEDRAAIEEWVRLGGAPSSP